MHRSKRLAGVTAALAALAIAAPIAQASAATWPVAWTWPAFPWGTVNQPSELYTAGVIARGPTVINSVFNGATVVQVVNGPAGSSVLGSP